MPPQFAASADEVEPNGAIPTTTLNAAVSRMAFMVFLHTIGVARRSPMN